MPINLNEVTGAQNRYPGALPSTRTRHSNLELLRIVSMLLIVTSHYAVHGQWPEPVRLTWNELFIRSLGLGNLGVNCFVLITGYYMISSRFKIRSILRIAMQTWFYSVGFLIAFSAVGRSVDAETIVRSLVPVTASSYWFVTTYIALYAVSPYLNRLAASMDAATYRRLLLVLGVVCSVVPTLVPGPGLGSDLAWFVFLYLLGGYMRSASVPAGGREGLPLMRVGVSLGVVLASIVVLTSLGQFSDIFYTYSRFLAGLYSPLMLVAALGLFRFFEGLRLGHNRMINGVAGTTFGVYLIHENLLFRPFLWGEVARNADFYYSDWLVLHAVLTIFGVFAAAMLIESMRARLLERPLSTWLEERLAGRFDSIDQWMNGISGQSV